MAARIHEETGEIEITAPPIPDDIPEKEAEKIIEQTARGTYLPQATRRYASGQAKALEFFEENKNAIIVIAGISTLLWMLKNDKSKKAIQ